MQGAHHEVIYRSDSQPRAESNKFKEVLKRKKKKEAEEEQEGTRRRRKMEVLKEGEGEESMFFYNISLLLRHHEFTAKYTLY